MAGLFDLPGLDMSTIVGLLPRMQEARQNAQMMEGASMLAGGNAVPPSGPLPPQGLDAAGSVPTPGTGIYPTQAAPPAQALDVPDNIAKVAAARGIPPPKQDLPSWASTDPSVGAALTGRVPMPMSRPTDVTARARAPAAPMDLTSDAQKAGGGDAAQSGDKMGDLAKALRGVTMPKSPELQKISSPSAPRATSSIKGGDLMLLLQALNAGPGVGGGLKLPSTLGQALGK